MLGNYSRRDWLKVSSVGMLSGVCWPRRGMAAVAYDDLKTADYLGEPKIVASVTTEKFFTEGPAYDGKGKLYFTNVAANQICRYDEATGKLDVYRENTNAANGLEFDVSGNLLACEGSANEQGRVVRINIKTGKLTVLADRFSGHPLGAPNDLVIDKQGRIYFTSRLAQSVSNLNVNAVYRIAPDVELTRILCVPQIDMPNGIEISPDGKTLYLVESDGRESRARCIRRYDLGDEGSVSNLGDVLIDFYPGRSGDGMCVDAEGNLYIAAGLHQTRKTSETLDTKPGIHVVTPAGKLVAFVETPVDTITNCCFGGKNGKTLYVTCGRHLIAIPSKRAGSRFA